MEASDKACCFFGHRLVPFSLKGPLTERIQKAIQEGYQTFYIGNHGDFDDLALSLCIDLRKQYPQIKIIVVLTSFSALESRYHDEFGEHVAKRYQDVETCFFDIEEVHYKQRITESNQQMAKRCNLAICYVDERRSRSGALRALKFARKNGCRIENLFTPMESPLFPILNNNKHLNG